jgi:hypothetical protein
MGAQLLLTMFLCWMVTLLGGAEGASHPAKVNFPKTKY